jgi:succinyl-CoA synthetase beta subunit
MPKSHFSIVFDTEARRVMLIHSLVSGMEPRELSTSNGAGDVSDDNRYWGVE